MELRERIIDVSLAMFFEQGIKTVRMDDIAHQMGISKRTIYEHFEDKQSLILEGLKFHSLKAKEHHKELASRTDNVIEQIFVLLRDWQKNSEMTSRFIMSIKRYYPAVYKDFSAVMADKGREDLQRSIQMGVDQGLLLKDVNYPLARLMLESAVEGIVFNQYTTLPEGMSIGEAFEYILIYFLRGIATERGREVIDDNLINIK